ncbi:hypothetical protein [Bradyrhizobium sp. AZCC 1693]|uniref:hypothetical protein n=1 Tax=Bradyrhizobium sp. AZCC 1693 TaxID=3117029 RepID=UPI002FEEB910
MTEQTLGKGSGRLAWPHVTRGFVDQSRPGLVITPRRHNVLHFSRRPTDVAIVRLILECTSSSASFSPELITYAKIPATEPPRLLIIMPLNFEKYISGCVSADFERAARLKSVPTIVEPSASWRNHEEFQ